ncbi:uncharacterized protein PGTG_22801 [Puccinia graminis f. sp. tritici CRL 75-36-700-3]|uniref:Uncharacterized protein n=1 Tax=Puccinia graminis f. sp. tritici (strain CRL 75-36-700-3 / race SCCL) TaxID=418459 RepID=H6QVN0_PUCGT|nr:uncharacterized protein PGTG_22801 [Puccinia graminis f. sp. tritici CRL 75-36-700-3]EHS63417.1 hypothetical protein PGTG_22801 [Puccinia graminis f. sp. tritici CRL 75-36-700-3]
MIEKSVYKHNRYNKHTSVLKAFYAARASGECLTVLDPVIDPSIGGASEDRLQAINSEVYEDAPTTAAWCRWEDIDDEPEVHAGQESSDCSIEKLDFSSEASSHSFRSGHASGSNLSDYNSNNKADDEEWDVPIGQGDTGGYESYGDNPTGVSQDEEPGHRRPKGQRNNPWWPYKSKEVPSTAPGTSRRVPAVLFAGTAGTSPLFLT